MSLFTQDGIVQGDSFSLFPQLPAEIRNHIWKISAQDIPSRIVDLREYWQPCSEETSTIKTGTDLNPSAHSLQQS